MSADFGAADIDLVRGFDSVDVGASLTTPSRPASATKSFECEPQILTQASDALICIGNQYHERGDRLHSPAVL
jgi:hypothetical protein